MWSLAVVYHRFAVDKLECSRKKKHCWIGKLPPGVWGFHGASLWSWKVLSTECAAINTYLMRATWGGEKIDKKNRYHNNCKIRAAMQQVAKSTSLMQQ